MSEPQRPMTEEERQRLIGQYQDLKERAEALNRQIEQQQRGQLQWGRIGLLGLALVAIGAGIYFATDSVLWAVVSTVVGVPAVVFLGIVIVASVQHAAAERERKREVPLGRGKVIADPERRLARLETDLTGDRLTLWLCEYLDYCVVRYSAKRWAPSNPGGRLVPRAHEWLLRVAAQAAGGPLDAAAMGDLGGWQPSAEPLKITRESADVELRLVRGTRGYKGHASEVMGMLHRGDVLGDSFLAIAAQVLGSGKVDASELGAVLLAQCEIYAARSNEIPEGQAVNEALGRHPALAARLSGG